MKYWLKATSFPTRDLPIWAKCAEELGFEGLTMGEHLLEPPSSGATANQPPTTSIYPYGDGVPVWPPNMNRPDPWVAFAACAAVTSRLRFMTSVVVPVHEPLNWAKSIATASVISNGRIALGVGAGWLKEEFAATGTDFKGRGKMLDARIELLQRLWAGGTVSVDVGAGSTDWRMSPPLPAATIPIMIGGSSPAALRRAAHHDGWLGAEVALDELPGIVAQLNSYRLSTDKQEPLQIVVALRNDTLDPVSYRRAEELGVTGIEVYGWHFQRPGDTEAGLAVLRSFADRLQLKSPRSSVR